MPRTIEVQTVEGYVWCDEHGEVHNAVSDPYTMDENCTSHHRPIYMPKDD